MSPKAILIALVSALPLLAAAQNANIAFPEAGDRQVWIDSAMPTQAPTDATGVRTSKASAEVPTNGAKDSSLVFIWDRKSGNLASKSLKDVGTLWLVQASDFKEIAQVGVLVQHDSKPVAAATVDLNDGTRTSTQLLDPSTNGLVTFFGVKPGSLKITVHYKVAGKDGQPLTQLFDAPLTHTDPVPTAKISIGDSVETIATAASVPSQTTGATPAAAGANKKTPTEDKEAGGGSIIGRIVIYLVALAVVVAVVYFAMMYVKNNPDSVGSKLEQLGVQVPKPGSDPLADPSQLAPAPVRPTPQPVQKIILSDAAPDPIAPAASGPTFATATAFGPTEPKLVSASGDAMPLPDGDFVVGRDIGLGLSLVGENSVSRRHAQLTRSGGQVTVKDLGSTNGTYVNGVQLQSETQLQMGDSVQFGSVRFRYEG